MKRNIADMVAGLAEPIAKDIGLEIFDVEYVKEGPDFFLRIYITKQDDSVGVDDCEALSRRLDPVLDDAEVISDSYYLEVSSVGLDRHLKTEKDFLWFEGKKIEVRLFAPLNGKKEFVGILKGYSDGVFKLLTDNDEQLEINIKRASLIRPYLEF